MIRGVTFKLAISVLLLGTSMVSSAGPLESCQIIFRQMTDGAALRRTSLARVESIESLAARIGESLAFSQFQYQQITGLEADFRNLRMQPPREVTALRIRIGNFFAQAARNRLSAAGIQFTEVNDEFFGLSFQITPLQTGSALNQKANQLKTDYGTPLLAVVLPKKGAPGGAYDEISNTIYSFQNSIFDGVWSSVEAHEEMHAARSAAFFQGQEVVSQANLGNVSPGTSGYLQTMSVDEYEANLFSARAAMTEIKNNIDSNGTFVDLARSLSMAVDATSNLLKVMYMIRNHQQQNMVQPTELLYARQIFQTRQGPVRAVLIGAVQNNSPFTKTIPFLPSEFKAEDLASLEGRYELTWENIPQGMQTVIRRRLQNLQQHLVSLNVGNVEAHMIGFTPINRAYSLSMVTRMDTLGSDHQDASLRRRYIEIYGLLLQYYQTLGISTELP